MKRVFLVFYLGLAAWAAESTAAESVTAGGEVWVAIRTDGQSGTGTQADPFDGGSVEKLNGLFERFRREHGPNLTIHFGPGVFHGDRMWEPMSNWKVRGAGVDVTVFRTWPDPNSTRTVGFRAGCVTGDERHVSGFELSDCTFDFNTPNLRKANRAFYVPDKRGPGGSVHYCHVTNPPSWSSDREYKRGDVVRHGDEEFIMIGEANSRAPKGAAPQAGAVWSILRWNHPAHLPAWCAGQTNHAGEARARDGRAYMCMRPEVTTAPADGTPEWESLDPEAPDPEIYTQAAFLPTRPPGGRHRISRVKAINGNGSAFFDREDFIFGVGGYDSVIEDCVVEQFHGDYASLIVLTSGRHGVVRGCTVYGNGRSGTMAYGGWGCIDAVFENNFGINCRAAVNIDSKANRNVIFRGNVFLQCRDVGILVNVNPEPQQFPADTMEVDGLRLDLGQRSMDGLFIYNNLVELAAGARYGGIQIQQDGLRNARVFNNVIRAAGLPEGLRAIGVHGIGATNVTICGNTCEPGMYSEVTPATVCRDNYDLAGQPMKDRQGRPIDQPLP